MNFLSRLHLFRGLDTDDLVQVAETAQVVELEENALLFEQDQDPDAFYIIQRGRVLVTRYLRGHREPEQLGFLDECDAIGYEMLEDRGPRQVTVQAMVASTLLRFDQNGLRRIFDRSPQLVPRFQLVLNSFRLQLQVHLPWVNPEEYVLYITRRSPFFLWVRLAPTLLIGLVVGVVLLELVGLTGVGAFMSFFWLGMAALVAAVVLQIIDWSNDYSIITNQRVVFQEKVILLYDSRQESPLTQIRSTDKRASYLGQLLDYGDLLINTFIGVVTFPGIPRPQEVQGILDELQRRTRSSLRQAELGAIEQTLRQRLNPPPPGPPRPVERPVEPPGPSRLQQFLADIFHMVYKVGNTIQYRTHWFILLKRIWFWTLAVIGVLAVELVMVAQLFRGDTGGVPLLTLLMVVWLAGFVPLGFLLYNYLDWHNDIYLITEDKVIDINRKPLGDEERREALIRNILSVEYERLGIIGQVLNFGTVYIRVGDSTLTFDNVPNPSEVQQELGNRIALRTLREREAQAQTERDRMADYLAVYDRIRRQNGPGQ